MRWAHDHPKLYLTSLSTGCAVVATAFLVVIALLLPPFDSSSSLVSPSRVHAPFLAWDATYFFSISQEGYRHEQELAFGPALPFLVRHGGSAIAWLRRSSTVSMGDRIVGGWIMSLLARVGSTLALYQSALLLLPLRYWPGL